MSVETDAITGFSRAVDELTRAFPSLRVRSSVDPAETHVQATASIPPQAGVEQGIGFSLVGDELHLEIGTTSFYVPWFPSTDPVVVENFVDAVVGFIEGRHRVMESYIGGQVVKSELQAGEADRWRTIATSSSPLALIPWRRRRVIVRNTAADAPRSTRPGRLTSA